MVCELFLAGTREGFWEDASVLESSLYMHGSYHALLYRNLKLERGSLMLDTLYQLC